MQKMALAYIQIGLTDIFCYPYIIPVCIRLNHLSNWFRFLSELEIFFPSGWNIDLASLVSIQAVPLRSHSL